MTRKMLTTDKGAAPVRPFSPALRAGECVYLSGQAAQETATGRLIATSGTPSSPTAPSAASPRTAAPGTSMPSTTDIRSRPR
jgi:hypothetical protein